MDKRLSLDDFAASLKPGTRIAFGGGGIQRKPMAAVAAIARHGVSELDLVSFLGGPEVDVLIGLGLARRLEFAFVGFDAYGLAPCFRAAREAGTLPVVEYSEATMLAAFEAGAKNLPFLPTRFALGTDIVTTPTSPFRTLQCPFTGETLLGVPALRPDVAVVHVNVADRMGNAVIHSDAYADSLLVRTARRTILTAERVVDDLPSDQSRRCAFISRLWVDGVIEAPGGAGMTAMFPDYRFNLPKVLQYQKNACNRAWLEDFVREGQA
ncbi:MAG: CoA-transferase [Burkholderiaceae bacterium]